MSTATTGSSYWITDYMMEPKPKDQMKTEWKVGDKAIFSGVLGMGREQEYEPTEVEFRAYSTYAGKQAAICYFPNEDTTWYVYLNQLTRPGQFKVGDRVKITRESESFNGNTGTILSQPKPGTWEVQTDYPNTFYEYNLILLSPQSPQPQQTNQQTEGQDMNPFIILYQNLANAGNGTIVGYHPTAEQAKEAAEAMAAQYRGNLTNKQYFTLTVVNSKTGQLIGSVTDAPPQVDWNAGK